MDNQTLQFVYVREDISSLCNELMLVVIATNTLGESDRSAPILPCYGKVCTTLDDDDSYKFLNTLQVLLLLQISSNRNLQILHLCSSLGLLHTHGFLIIQCRTTASLFRVVLSVEGEKLLL